MGRGKGEQWEVQLLDAGHLDGKAAMSKESNKVPMIDRWDEQGIVCRSKS